MSIPQTIDLTFRIFVLLLAMTIGVFFVIVGARNAMAANLKTVATVSDSVFTVGDIFSGISREKAEKVLGPAPLPGHDLVLNARTLMRVASALDLPWQPSSAADQIVIRRAATMVPAAVIEDTISGALRDKGMDGSMALTFFGGDAPKIVLPEGENPTVELADVKYDPQSGKFEALLMAPSRQKSIVEMNVAGRVERMVPVPVLKSTLSSGAIINASDLAWIDVRDSELQGDTIINADDLTGMTPKRMIVAGKSIRALDLERPQLVSRGETITIAYSAGPMMLTAQGKAMQGGAKGDLIRVVNTSSNMSIDAFVDGDGIVKVMP